jgi:dienelactone hydrolase
VTEAPSIHVRSERDGFAADVTSIVYSDAIHVRVDGVAPGAEVTLAAEGYSPYALAKGFRSEATFVADAEGVVDTSRAASMRGTYTGIDSDGLTWSQAPIDLAEQTGIDRAALFVSAAVNGAEVASFTLHRTLSSPDVHVERVTTDGLAAELWLPAGSSGRVPIVAFGGSEGGILGGEGYAARMASWGHPVLALAYFNAPGLPSALSEIPLEYFGKAFAYLDGRPEVAHGRAIVMGASRGGELALLLGSKLPNVVGVVADAPSAYVWPSVDGTKAAWTKDGHPLSYVTGGFTGAVSVTTPSGTTAYAMRAAFEHSLASASEGAREAARIHVENTNGPVLLFGGHDDALWPSCPFIDAATEALESSGHKAAHGDDAVCFPDAGHAITFLGASTAMSMWSPSASLPLALGGTAAGNAHAARERDAKVRTFLDRFEN